MPCKKQVQANIAAAEHAVDVEIQWVLLLQMDTFRIVEHRRIEFEVLTTGLVDSTLETVTAKKLLSAFISGEARRCRRQDDSLEVANDLLSWFARRKRCPLNVCRWDNDSYLIAYFRLNALQHLQPAHPL